MKFPPVKRTTYARFLESLGLEFQRMGKGDHELWNTPNSQLLRPITFITNHKEVEHFYQKTNLETLRMSGINLTNEEYVRRLRNA